MTNGNQWYGGRSPGYDWWKRWAYKGPKTRQYPRQLPGPRAPYGGEGRYGRQAGDPFGPEWNRLAARRPQPQPLAQPGPGPGVEVSYAVPGQVTPSQGFGQVPYGGMPGPYGEPTVTTPAGQGWVQPAISGIMTPVEEALARVGMLAAGGQPAQPTRPQSQFPGYWEAIGAQPGNYPVPQGAVQGMWGARRPWEEWSWRTRGIPLQGNEILRVEGGRMPWGGRPREPNLDPQGRNIGWLSKYGGGGRASQVIEPPAWRPGAWGSAF